MKSNGAVLMFAAGALAGPLAQQAEDAATTTPAARTTTTSAAAILPETTPARRRQGQQAQDTTTTPAALVATTTTVAAAAGTTTPRRQAAVPVLDPSTIPAQATTTAPAVIAADPATRRLGVGQADTTTVADPAVSTAAARAVIGEPEMARRLRVGQAATTTRGLQVGSPFRTTSHPIHHHTAAAAAPRFTPDNDPSFFPPRGRGRGRGRGGYARRCGYMGGRRGKTNCPSAPKSPGGNAPTPDPVEDGEREVEGALPGWWPWGKQEGQEPKPVVKERSKSWSSKLGSGYERRYEYHYPPGTEDEQRRDFGENYVSNYIFPDDWVWNAPGEGGLGV